MSLSTRLRPVLPVLSLVLLSALAGCGSAPDTDEPQVISGSGAPSEGPSAGSPSDDSPTTAGGPGQSATTQEGDDSAATQEGEASGEISAVVQPDGTILVEGSQAAFLMPSKNVACVMKPDGVVCQIDGKKFEAKKGDINPETFEGCTRKTADAMTVGDGADPTWVCLPYDIRPGTDVASGGAWAGPGIGATDTLGETSVAVLPYGSTIRLGNMSCASDSAGVDCTDLSTGRGFQLAREGYSTH